MTNKTNIEELLDSKAKINETIFSEFGSLFHRTIEIYLKISISRVEWGDIRKVSPHSSFAKVDGTVVVEKGQNIGSHTVENDLLLEVSFFVEINKLYSSTPYQLADILHKMSMLKKLVSPQEFMDLLKSTEMTSERIDDYLPTEALDNRSEQSKEEHPAIDKDEFDTSSLTESQIKELKLHIRNIYSDVQ